MRTNSTYSGSVNVQMIIPLLSYGFSYPIRQFGFVKSLDLPTGTQTIPMFGTKSTYYASTTIASTSQYNCMTGYGEANSTHRLIMRWE